jgi:hypothetical protein
MGSVFISVGRTSAGGNGRDCAIIRHEQLIYGGYFGNCTCT